MLTIPAVLITSVLAFVLSPLIFALAAVVDLLTLRRWSALRTTAFVLNAMLVELAGLAWATQLWFRHGFGTRLDCERSQRSHNQIVYWYFAAHWRSGERWFRLRLEVDPSSAPMAGGAIAIGRHASYGDAAIPVLLASPEPDIRLRHVLMKGLLWGPCFDVVGSRMPIHFVDRGNADLDAIGELGTDLDPKTLMMIFPEGGFYSPARHARRVERLRESDPALAQRANMLRHLLPPRPGGLLRLLQAAPDADLVLIGHVGFEGFSSIHTIVRSVPFTAPVRVRSWRYDRADLPTEPSDQVDWLYERWAELDAWIDRHQ